MIAEYKGECLIEQEENTTDENKNVSKDKKSKHNEISRDKKAKKENTKAKKDDEVFKIYEEPSAEEEKHQIIKNKKVIAIASMALIVFLVACIGYIKSYVKLDHFETALHNGGKVSSGKQTGYEEAAELYKNFSDKEKAKANDLVLEKIDEITNSYYDKDEKRNAYFTWNNEYKELLRVHVNEKDVEKKIYQKIERFKELEKSEKNYEEANKKLERKQYEDAILTYNKVDKNDKNYESAKLKLSEAVRGYKEEKFKIADDKVKTTGNYDEAIKTMDDCLKLLPEDENIKEKKESYVDGKLKVAIKDIKDTAWDFERKSEYTKAVYTLKDAIKTYGEKKELTEELDKLKNSMKEKAKDYADNSDLDNASNIIEQYLRADAEDEEMKELKEKYKPSSKCDMLTKMSIKDTSGSYYILNETSMEVSGYKNIQSDGSFSVKNEGYKKVTGILSYSNEEYFKDGVGKLTIKVDDSEVKSYTLKYKDVEELDLELPEGSNITFNWDMDSSSDKPYNITLDNLKFIEE